MNGILVAVGGAKGSRACVAACARLFADRPPAVILLHVMQYGGPAAADGLSSDAELAGAARDDRGNAADGDAQGKG